VITTAKFHHGDFLLFYPGDHISITEGRNRESTYPDHLGSYIFFMTGAWQV